MGIDIPTSPGISTRGGSLSTSPDLQLSTTPTATPTRDLPPLPQHRAPPRSHDPSASINSSSSLAIKLKRRKSGAKRRSQSRGSIPTSRPGYATLPLSAARRAAKVSIDALRLAFRSCRARSPARAAPVAMTAFVSKRLSCSNAACAHKLAIEACKRLVNRRLGVRCHSEENSSS